MLISAHSTASPLPSERTLCEVRLGTSAFLSRKDTLFCPLACFPVSPDPGKRIRNFPNRSSVSQPQYLCCTESFAPDWLSAGSDSAFLLPVLVDTITDISVD